MAQEHYQCNKEQLLANPKLPPICMTDNSQVFEVIVKQMVEEIEDHNAKGEKTVSICPVGPVGQYSYLVDTMNGRNTNLKNVQFINMDEYLDDDKHWVSMEHPLSFRGFMEQTVYSKIKPELVMPKEQRVFPDPENITYIPELIEKLGGVDIAFGGIGINGHVASNEMDPLLFNQEFLTRRTRALRTASETRMANVVGDFNGAPEDVSRYCATIGIYEIAHARETRLGCFRNWHRAVVRRTVYGESTAEFPVTLLHNHPDITLTFTDHVAVLTD